MVFLASSVALRMASGTSRALPWPKPTRPFWSPTTIRAANEKRRPPLTVAATRLMWTSFSTISLSPRSSGLFRSRRSRRSPPPRCCSPRAMLFSLEVQAGFAGRFRERLDAPMKNVTAAVEDHVLEALFEGALGNQGADLGRRLPVSPGHALAGFQRGCGRQGDAQPVIDDL